MKLLLESLAEDFKVEIKSSSGSLSRRCFC